MHLSTDILVVGAGGAGMYAAVAAARNDATVLLVDRSLVGRGGATIMAQMTVAAAIGHEEPDDWTLHLEDTLAAGREICDETLTEILCQEGPDRIFELDRWGVHWARGENGKIRQIKAPGHSRSRCCYVDFLNTGPGVAGALRRQTRKSLGIHRLSNVDINEVVVHEGRAIGAVGFDLVDGNPISIEAKAVILAAGGLSGLYLRNSASANMAGHAYALALWAGAELTDMEFVQFFPIAHLAPRLVGMDPILWDPFRYKLGGRLLNGAFEEFIHRYGGQDAGTYTTVRDEASYAILKEVEAGRGSPHGGVYLDFRHVGEAALRSAFGPVIDRLLANGIDLTQTPVEVGPTAHYHMGGILVNQRMETRVPGLYAAGEAVGGANGANRLSGNAITEALVFGERAGRFAARAVQREPRHWELGAAREALERFAAVRAHRGPGSSPAEIRSRLRELMWNKAGPFRTAKDLRQAKQEITGLTSMMDVEVTVAPQESFNLDLADWFQLKAMLTTAGAVVSAALCRQESRGAHQRLDFPNPDLCFTTNQVQELEGMELRTRWVRVKKSSMRCATSNR